MANNYKNIVVTPNSGSSTDDPKIVFSGANTGTNTDITLRMYPESNGTLSFEGSAGQLFSVTNDMSGSLFTVNDVSGIPSVDVSANGNVVLAPYGGNVGIGTTSPYYKLDVNGYVNAAAVLVNGAAISPGMTLLQTLTANNSAALQTTNCFFSAFNNYTIVIDIIPTSSSQSLNARVYSGGVYLTSNYNYSNFTSGPTASGQSSTAGTLAIVSPASAMATSEIQGYSSVMFVADPTNTTRYKKFINSGMSTLRSTSGFLWTGSAGAITGIQFFMNTGTIASGSIKIYGWN